MCKNMNRRVGFEIMFVSLGTEAEGDPNLLLAARCVGRPVLWWQNGPDGSSSPSLWHADSGIDKESPIRVHTCNLD